MLAVQIIRLTIERNGNATYLIGVHPNHPDRVTKERIVEASWRILRERILVRGQTTKLSVGLSHGIEPNPVSVLEII